MQLEMKKAKIIIIKMNKKIMKSLSLNFNKIFFIFYYFFYLYFKYILFIYILIIRFRL